MKTRNLLVFAALLLQDYILHEKMARFNRNAFRKGWYTQKIWRFGTITVTHDISKYTKAKMFSEIGKETKVWLGSQPWAEKGSADTERAGFCNKVS
jgi:catalase